MYILYKLLTIRNCKKIEEYQWRTTSSSATYRENKKEKAWSSSLLRNSFVIDEKGEIR